MDPPQIIPNNEAPIPSPKPEPDYHSFLLRMWLIKDGDEVRWRASLEEVQSGEFQGFSDVQELLAYLVGLTEPHQVREVVVDSATPQDRAGKTQE